MRTAISCRLYYSLSCLLSYGATAIAPSFLLLPFPTFDLLFSHFSLYNRGHNLFLHSLFHAGTQPTIADLANLISKFNLLLATIAGLESVWCGDVDASEADLQKAVIHFHVS